MVMQMKKFSLICILNCALTLFLTTPVSAGSDPVGEARTLFEDRKYAQAVSLIKKEIRKTGESADNLVLMADCYVALGKTSKAEKTYRQALTLDPGHLDGNLNFGMLLVAMRKRDEAITLFKGVLAEKPDHARAHFGLGMAYNARADITDAFGQYKILKKLDKELATELYNAIFLK
jgi:Tfp pilus assembly protein PilF